MVAVVINIASGSMSSDSSPGAKVLGLDIRCNARTWSAVKALKGGALELRRAALRNCLLMFALERAVSKFVITTGLANWCPGTPVGSSSGWCVGRGSIVESLASSSCLASAQGVSKPCLRPHDGRLRDLGHLHGGGCWLPQSKHRGRLVRLLSCL